MFSLLLRNLFFFIVHPGLVAGLIPYYMLGKQWNEIYQSWNSLQFIAILIFTLGFSILILCILQFATEGRGTLSPIDPTKKLVIHGLYKISRNPMYVGVMLMLVGEALFFQSSPLWQYTLFIFLVFHAFVLLHEEPRLRKMFGDEYQQYCSKVRRWI